MWQKLLKVFEQAPPPDAAAQRRMASAVLLLECARADFDNKPAEVAVVRAELMRSFALSEAELDALLQTAEREQRQAVSLYSYTSQLNRELDADGKRELMAMLWRVAYADGRLDAHEEHLLRKLADLLYVPHSAFIIEKLSAANPT